MSMGCLLYTSYTYFAADIAYHRNKLEVRKFDKAVDVWGADHHLSLIHI